MTTTAEQTGTRQDAAPAAPAAPRWHEHLPSIATLLGLAVVWEIAGHTLDYAYLPPLSDVFVRLWELVLDGTIPRELGASLTALAVGMLIAVVAGVLIGLLMGAFPLVRYTLDVYVDAVMVAPVVAFVPLFILLFGLGFQTRVATVVLFAICPIIVNTAAGVRSVDRNLVTMARSFQATPAQTFWQVQLPMAWGHVQAGLRLGVARGVDGVITGEVLIAVVGLGGLITRFGDAFSMDRLYAVVFVIVALVVLSTRLVDLAGRLLVRGRHER
ncbi:ABC transporter permease [Phytohabitans kaempferiae]|uniref:ABC transporter permease n=1 Tax=Phytohabitans kaempferiae TaxID=1620943 RepID=A0ABV6MB75_9ACTN